MAKFKPLLITAVCITAILKCGIVAVILIGFAAIIKILVKEGAL